jgi:hypothetical protein
MKRQVNIFDRIGSLIPGYTGYAKRANQRTSDKLIRERIAKRLNDVESAMNSVITRIIRKEESIEFLEAEELRKFCSTLSSNVRYAAYGASALFDREQIKDDELDEIYRLDEQLLDHVNSLILIVNQHNESNQRYDDIRSMLMKIKNLNDQRSNYIQFMEKS